MLYAYARVTRGGVTESLHRVRLAACRSDGTSPLATAGADTVTFLRSSWKPLQALGVVTSGAADAFALTPEELAVCCASHSGEPDHVKAVRSALGKAGLSEADLKCGSHWPIDAKATEDLRSAGGSPTAVHNNCSGKHAGMLVHCAHKGWPVEGYLDPAHPVQQEILRQAAALCGLTPPDVTIGTDGCTAPTWGMRLAAGALGWARLGAADWGPPELRAACRRVTDAMGGHPWYVGGTGRQDTDIMRTTHGRLVCKGGAEGCVAVCAPSEGIAIVAKAEDGNGRGAYPVVLEALRRLELVTNHELLDLATTYRPEVRNCNAIRCGEVVGEIGEAPPESALP